MSNLREAYAATALAGLGWDENKEKAIDRVAAAGKADAFGILLWRSKYMLESVAYAQARNQLLNLYRKRYRDNTAVSVAMVEQGLREYLAPACRVCRGVGDMLVNERLVVCEACGGCKIHRYSDSERARTMKLSFALVKASSHKLRWLLELLGTSDKRVNMVMNVELERFKIVE